MARIAYRKGHKPELVCKVDKSEEVDMSGAGHVRGSDPPRENIAPPASLELIARVNEYARAGHAQHAVVMGGFGAGKSYSLARAADAAHAAGLRVARLERGPIGISSFADFLVAVAKSTRPASWPRSDLERWRLEYADDVDQLERRVTEGAPLVIVVESLDQLLHQVRAADRPRIIRLLHTSAGGPLVLGSVHGGGSASEVGDDVAFLQATPLASVADGIAFAIQQGERFGVVAPDAPEQLAEVAQHLHPTLAGNWLFWSLVGRYLVVSRRDPVVRAEEELRARAASHFDGMLVSLAPSEQRILVEIAESGSARSVGDLADAIGVRNQAAATALSRLLADDWVRVADEVPKGADRRRTWYDIADPMLRWHLLPMGEGSVGEFILTVREAWWLDEDRRTRQLDDGTRLDAADDAARRRGEAGDSSAARSWFEFAVLERVVRDGIHAASVIETLLEYGVWVGESGDLSRAAAILDSVAAEADASLGAGSALALSAHNAAGWNLLAQGDLESAAARFRAVAATVPRPDDRYALAQVIRAQQDLGRALGDMGLVDQAVEQMTLAVDRTEALLADAVGTERADLERELRRRRHGLYYWMARQPGGVEIASRGLAELAEHPGASAHDRFAVRLDLLEVQAAQHADAAVGSALLELAAEIDAGDAAPDDLMLAARARRRALELRMDGGDPSMWPLEGVDGSVLAELFGERLRDNNMTLDEVDRSLKSASLDQLRALVASSTARGASRGDAAALIELAMKNVAREPEHRLMSDLLSLVSETDAPGSPLPLEWRQGAD